MQLNWNDVAENMKRMEKAESTKLDPTKPIIVRLDMRSGGSFVRGLKKPFDENFTDAMTTTAQKLAEQVQGTQLAYVGSDEITLVLMNNGTKQHFIPFFEGKLQKIVSLTAAIATAEFNQRWMELIQTQEDEEYKQVLSSKLFRARFDSRVFNIDGGLPEALLSIWWRVNDVRKNSIQMLARKYFSQKQLNNVKTTQMLQMLEEIGHPWDTEVYKTNKYGDIFIREAYLGEGYNPKTKQAVETIRHAWFNSSEENLIQFQQISQLDDFVNSDIAQRWTNKIQ